MGSPGPVQAAPQGAGAGEPRRSRPPRCAFAASNFGHRLAACRGVRLASSLPPRGRLRQRVLWQRRGARARAAPHPWLGSLKPSSSRASGGMELLMLLSPQQSPHYPARRRRVRRAGRARAGRVRA